VTRFHTSAGQLSEVRRFYVQNGKVIPNANSTIAGIVGDSITEKYCEDKRNVFNEGHPMFSDFGGMAAMTAALAKGMVLTMKIDDFPAIGQIDSTFPPDLDPNAPGMRRGTCMPWTWDPNWPLTETSPDSTVFFKNFRYGPIGSTYP
jgi:cellulose 1,4-beta-cellobiosidase